MTNYNSKQLINRMNSTYISNRHNFHTKGVVNIIRDYYTNLEIQVIKNRHLGEEYSKYIGTECTYKYNSNFCSMLHEDLICWQKLNRRGFCKPKTIY